MGMGNGDGQSIGRVVVLGRLAKAQQAADHILDLAFIGAAESGQSLLNLQRRVFGDRKPSLGAAQQQHAARLAHGHRRRDVLAEQQFFDRGGHLRLRNWIGVLLLQDLRGEIADLDQVGLCSRDVLVGIATSGRTPYVLAGLDHARQCGAYAIALSCSFQAAVNSVCDLAITPLVGPEVISGSTRLKAGTATKMVLNMLSTGAMVLLGKTYGNLMVDLRATNSKLVARSRRIVHEATGISEAEAERLLADCGGEVKTAIVMHVRRVSADQSRQLLQRSGGQLRGALESDGG